MRVTIDSNVFIASLIKTVSPPATILDEAFSGRLTIVTTKTQLAEIGRVLHKPSVKSYTRCPDDLISMFIKTLKKHAEVVKEVSYPTVVSDVPDNAILACAVDGEADVIITGDAKHLLPLGEYMGIPIITPRQFVDEYL